jgi:hypothetical protein
LYVFTSSFLVTVSNVRNSSASALTPLPASYRFTYWHSSRLPWLHLGTDRVENTVSNSSSIACGFVAVERCSLRCRYLVTDLHATIYMHDYEQCPP